MRKGSALLIVLGMISFMLFSGIAFSVYMRQTRLPSSFLRRTTVTRQLTKAALAEAIRDIDFAIGENPHPGVSQDSNDRILEIDGIDYKFRNLWMDRIFVGRKRDSDTDDPWVTGDTDFQEENDAEGQQLSPSQVLVNSGDTVSTLTLEGLAYLPPSLINEARYYSRHTPTARWHSFRFDAGRYAYCAIDVSDYFDVNRLLADRPRSSASSRRITLAHAFESAGEGGLHGKQQTGGAEKWDAWLDDSGVRTVDDDTDEITFSGKMPLVSLADFNLCMAEQYFGSDKRTALKSPFVSYLNSSGSAFYPEATSSEDDSAAEAYRSMTFVTDSLFRETTEEEIDLENGDNQPFDPSAMKRSATVNLKAMQDGSNSRTQIESYLQLLSRIGMATLFDYLDENALPISLAIPSAERNPMICAMNPEYEDVSLKLSKTVGKLKNGKGGDKLDIAATEREVSATIDYIIDGGALGMSLAGKPISGYALYPFLHDDGTSKATYTLDGKLALFLTLNDERLRMTVDEGNSAFTFGKNGGSDPANSVELDDNGILSLPLKGTMSVPSSVKTADDALVQFTVNPVSANMASIKSKLSKTAPWISVTYRWTQKLIDPPEGVDDNESYRNNTANWTPQLGDEGVQTWEHVVGGGTPASGDSRTMKCAWYPLKQKAAALFNPVTDLQTIYGYLSDETKFHINLAVWLRIKRSGGGEKGGTVDMVPACIYDDKEQQLTTMNPQAIQFDENLSRYYRLIEGRGRHIMRFDLTDGNGGGFSIKDLDGGDKTYTLEVSPKKIMVADPRYNHNPANWFRLNDGDDLLAAWKESSNNPYAERDGDFFMSSSDQGYLQSVYEIGMLPRLTNPKEGTRCDQVGENLRALDQDIYNRTDFASGFGSSQQRDVMWRTYRVFGTDADPLYGPGFISGIKGLKVNPFSDSLEILSAAFANTPADWRHASTNETMNAASTLGTDAFNAKYAWNAYSTGTTKLMWDDIQMLAEAYYNKVRSSGYNTGKWEEAFEDLNWSTDKRKLIEGGEDSELDGNSSDLYSVDKKYLYGFWHDSLAVNQQLFLVFVRAEPMMMGGGVAGNAPPQLSSRAVALVWRDPEGRKSGTSADDSSYMPHGLRVLFYHPLD